MKLWAAFPLLLMFSVAHGQQAPPLVGLPPQQANVILKRVDDRYNHLGSLRARFTERYSGMGIERTENGTLLLRKPGRMAFQYDRPAGKTFVFDGRFAYFYTPGDPQATRVHAKQLDDLHTPLRFLLGHTELGKELEGVVVYPVSGGFRITGVPHGMAARIHSITLQVTPDGTIQSLSLEEADGALTGFTLPDQQPNAPTADHDFSFTAPPGVTIIAGGPPI